MEAIKLRIQNGTEFLIASNDENFDRITKGMLRAYKEIVDHEVEYTDLLELIEKAAEREDN